MHRVASAELDWYIITGSGKTVQRAKTPRLILHTACGVFYSTARRSRKAQTCQVPAPGAVLCKACEKRGRNFTRAAQSRDGDTGLTRREAHLRLGCAAKGVDHS